MGRDLSLLLERYSSSGWGVPLDLVELFPNGSVLSVWEGVPTESRILSALEINWWSIRKPATSLFAGRDTPLAISPGIPSDATLGSKRYFLQNWPPDDPYLGSIAVQDLSLDDWNQSLVTLRGKWPSWIGRLTEDGTKTRVELEDALTQIPMSDIERDQLKNELHCGRITSYPIDQSEIGIDRGRKTNAMMDITWREPLDSFADCLMPMLRTLQSIDSGEHRIIIG